MLADAYLPFGPSWPVGHPGNTGAGLVMAQQAGAALWHMYGCFGWFAFRAPDFPAPFAVDFSGASHVFTDADGRRFADETGYEVHDRLRALLTYLPRNANRPRLPSWAVFDEAARRAGPLNGLLGTRTITPGARTTPPRSAAAGFSPRMVPRTWPGRWAWMPGS